MLPDHIGGEVARRLPSRRGAGRPEIAAVHRLVGHRIIVEARALGVGARYAYREGIAQRHVEHAADAPRVVIADLGLQRAFELVARLVGDHVDHAAGRVAPVKRALRPAQHLDPLDVEIFLLEQAIAQQRRVVERDRDRRVGGHRDRLGADPADREIVAAEIVLREIDVGHRAQQLGTAFDLVFVERLAGEGRQRDRHLLDRLRLFLRGDDDIGIRRNLVIGGSGGRCGRLTVSRRTRGCRGDDDEHLSLTPIGQAGPLEDGVERHVGCSISVDPLRRLAASQRGIGEDRNAALQPEIAQREVERLRRDAIGRLSDGRAGADQCGDPAKRDAAQQMPTKPQRP